MHKSCATALISFTDTYPSLFEQLYSGSLEVARKRGCGFLLICIEFEIIT